LTRATLPSGCFRSNAGRRGGIPSRQGRQGGAMHHEYEVMTIDGDKIGHLVDEHGEYLIVEHGLLKSKHALPKTFTETDETEGVIRTTLSKQLVYDSPKVNGHFDREAVAEHYGLAEGFADPPTRALGELEPDDP